MSRVVDFAAYAAYMRDGRRSEDKKRGRGNSVGRKRKSGGCGIGELSLSAGRANKETAAVLIAEFSTRVGGEE